MKPVNWSVKSLGILLANMVGEFLNGDEFHASRAANNSKVLVAYHLLWNNDAPLGVCQFVCHFFPPHSQLVGNRQPNEAHLPVEGFVQRDVKKNRTKTEQRELGCEASALTG
jgi:hypothetical protein